MNTRITEMLGIEYPIIQGGMAWVAEHQPGCSRIRGRRSGTDRRRKRSWRSSPRRDPQGKRADKEAFWCQCYAVKPTCR